MSMRDGLVKGNSIANTEEVVH